MFKKAYYLTERSVSELVKKALEADLNEMKTNETKYLMENYTANMIYKNINKSIGWK